MPLAGATVLVWVVKLVALGLLFYAAFWLALVLLVGVAAAWTASNSTVDDDRWTQPDELRNGEAGFGLYSSSGQRSEEHTSELQSLMRISYAVFCLKKKKIK